MSYDISLRYPGDDKPVWVDRHCEGGIYMRGGVCEVYLNVTYNYSWFYHRLIDGVHGIYWLHGKKARDTVDVLEYAVSALGTQQYKDYYAATPGNAGYALSLLLRWARVHPEAVWEGD